MGEVAEMVVYMNWQNIFLRNALLIPLGIFLLVAASLLFRRDKGAFVFKGRAELTKDEKLSYYLFHTLKYVAIALALINPFMN